MYEAYPAIFHVAENGGYWVEFPDLPDCVSEGASLAEAAAEVRSTVSSEAGLAKPVVPGLLVRIAEHAVRL